MKNEINPMLYPGLPLWAQNRALKSMIIDRKQTKYSNDLSVSEKVPLVICNELDVSMYDLQSTSRKHELSEARAIIIYILKIRTKLKWREIGAIFNRQHCTAIYSYSYVEDQMSISKQYELKILRLLKMTK